MPTAKPFFRLEDCFRRRRKRFSIWKIDFADGETFFRPEDGLRRQGSAFPPGR
jgi:hypothetical protein